jgi:hypothetical protein
LSLPKVRAKAKKTTIMLRPAKGRKTTVRPQPAG